MTLHFTHLLFITTLSVTLAACSTNPINNPITRGEGYTGSNVPIQTPVTTHKDPYSYNNTNINKYNYQDNTNYTGGGDGGATTTTDYENYTNSTHQTGFVVQLIASISQEKATGIKETFAAEGYPAIQNSIERNGQILYRVQIGPYATKSEARAMLNKMRQRYQHNPYVDVAFINKT
jgi:septal ring-binding cell division protein DamX